MSETTGAGKGEGRRTISHVEEPDHPVYATPDADDASEDRCAICKTAGNGEPGWTITTSGPLGVVCPACFDASTGASEGLSEAERESLRNTVENYACVHPVGSPVESDGRCSQCLAIATPVYAVVERIVAARVSAAATKRVEDAAQTIVLMPAEHRPRSVVASIFTGHTLGCTCEVCAFMGEEPSAAATQARGFEPETTDCVCPPDQCNRGPGPKCEGFDADGDRVAETGDVEALATAISEGIRVRGYHLSQPLVNDVARAILASGWLDAVRRTARDPR